LGSPNKQLFQTKRHINLKLTRRTHAIKHRERTQVELKSPNYNIDLVPKTTKAILSNINDKPTLGSDP